MLQRPALVLLVLLVPGFVRAEQVPERLLSTNTQVYICWDGIEAHRAEYHRTPLGKMMKGDMGHFVDSTFGRIKEGIGALLTVDQLLSGTSPDKLQQMEADATQAMRMLNVLGKHGFILGVEVTSLDPQQVQVTLILPGAGSKPKPVLSALRLLASLNKIKVTSQKIGERTVSAIQQPPVTFAWWVEGKDVVLRAGTLPLPKLVQTPKADQQLTTTALFKRVSNFKKFPTHSRGFIDVPALVKLGRSRGKKVSKMLDDLGLTGVKSIVLYSGFESGADRSLVEMEIAGPRKGILALLKGKPYQMSDVPPLPPEVISWSMTQIDSAKTYDVVLQVLENVVRLVDPDELPEVRKYPQQAKALLGIDLRKDLLAYLGTRVVQYNTPTEGPLTLGQTLLVEVKDERKVDKAVQQLIKGLAALADGQVQLKKRTYHGVPIREVHVRQQGFFFVPTYAIHKHKTGTWLAISLFPQPVQGFLARAQGELPVWKMSKSTAASFRQLPQSFHTVSYADPRPSIKQLFSMAPFLVGLINNLNKDLNLDVGSIPNSQQVTQHLFPNLTVVTDDGNMLRLHSRASIALPFDIVGLDSYFLFVGYAFAAAAF